MQRRIRFRAAGAAAVLTTTLALVATVQADVRYNTKVRLQKEGLQPAKQGEVFHGVLKITVGHDARAAEFKLHGKGWVIQSMEAPEGKELLRGETVLVPFLAIPSNPSEPLGFSFSLDGEVSTSQLLLGEADLERLQKPHKLVFIQGPPQPQKPFAQGDDGNEPSDPSAAGGDPCENMSLLLTGRFVYERDGEDCLGAGECVGADNITVMILDSDSVGSETIWEGVTDQSGNFNVFTPWDDCDIFGCDCPDIYLRVEASTSIVSVEETGILEHDYAWSTEDDTIEDFSGSAVDFGTVTPLIEEKNTNAAVHIHNSIVRAHRFILTRDGTDVEKVDVQWPEDAGAWYDPGSEEIHIGADRQWSEPTHTHEYGHHFLNNYSVNTTPDYCNGFCDDATGVPNCYSDPTGGCGHCIWCPETDHDAWNEGWPNWLGDVVTRSYPGDYAGYLPLFTRSQEALFNCCQDGNLGNPLITEGFAGALCRDIEDIGEDANGDTIPDVQPECASDSLALGVNEIFTVVRLDLPETPLQFINAFRTRFPAQAVGLWRTANAVGGAAYVWPDTTPPDQVTVASSPTHPIGVGGTSPVIVVDWEPAADDASGATDYSIVWDTSPIEPDFTEDITGQTQATSAPSPVGTQLYLSLRARDCLGNWSEQWASFGPFVVTECNGNGIIDECETDCSAFGGFCAAQPGCGAAPDCNDNAAPDACDIALKSSNDCNNNGVPDDCEAVDYKSWILASDGAWNDPVNWEGDALPAPGDNVCISVPNENITVTVTGGTQTIASLGCQEDLTLSFPNFNISESSVVRGALSFNGGSINGDADLDLYGPVTWESGGMNGNAATRVFNTLTWQGASARTLSNGRDLNITDTDWLGGNVHVSDTSRVQNFGHMDILGADRTMLGFTANTRFNNESSATVTKHAATGFTAFQIPVENDGVFTVDEGELRFTSGFTCTGAVNGATGGTVLFSGTNSDIGPDCELNIGGATFAGGTTNIDGLYNVSQGVTVTSGTVNWLPTADIVDYGDFWEITFGTANVNTAVNAVIEGYTQSGGTLTGDTDFTVNGPSQLSGGIMSGSGVTSFAAGLTISGTATKSLMQNREWHIPAGQTALREHGAINFWDDTVFNNDGLFQTDSDDAMTRISGAPLIDNAGEFLKTGPDTLTMSVAFNNTGAVTITNGTLNQTGAVTCSGTVQSENGATYQLGGTTQEFDAASVIDVDNLTLANGTGNHRGQVDVANETLVSGGGHTFHPESSITSLGQRLRITFGTLIPMSGDDIALNEFVQSNGTLAGDTLLMVADSAQIDGGILRGSGRLRLDGGGAQDGLYSLQQQARLSNSAGQTYDYLDGPINFWDDSTFNNEGIFNAVSDDNVTRVTGNPLFQNAGAFNKLGPNTLTVTTRLQNSGVIDVQNGVLALNHTATGSGAFNAAPGATLAFGGLNSVLDESSTVDCDTLASTAGDTEFRGDVNVGSLIRITGGVMTIDEAATVSNMPDAFNISFGTLAVEPVEAFAINDLTQSSGTLTGAAQFNIQNTAQLSGGSLAGSSSLNVNGGADLSGSPYNLRESATFYVPPQATVNHSANGFNMWDQSQVINDGVFILDSAAISRITGTPAFFNNGALHAVRPDPMSITVDVENAGLAEFEDSTTTFSADYVQSAGRTHLAGGILSKSGVNPIQLNAGRLDGSGQINGTTNNNGAVVAPGDSIGAISISQAYNQAADGVLEIEVGGSPMCDAADQLLVTGNVALAGTLRILLTDGCLPDAGQSFTIMTYNDRVGTFDFVEAICETSPIAVTVAYAANEITLTFNEDIPEADLDLSGDADLLDFAAFQTCFSGPGAPMADCCRPADLDLNGAIDLDDYALWQAAATAAP